MREYRATFSFQVGRVRQDDGEKIASVKERLPETFVAALYSISAKRGKLAHRDSSQARFQDNAERTHFLKMVSQVESDIDFISQYAQPQVIATTGKTTIDSGVKGKSIDFSELLPLDSYIEATIQNDWKNIAKENGFRVSAVDGRLLKRAIENVLIQKQIILPDDCVQSKLIDIKPMEKSIPTRRLPTPTVPPSVVMSPELFNFHLLLRGQKDIFQDVINELKKYVEVYLARCEKS